MTARDGYYENAGASATGVQLFSDEQTKLAYDGQLALVTQAAVANAIYKNHGWYAAGSVWEVWVTSGAPSTVPPSGHTLTNIGFVVLQG